MTERENLLRALRRDHPDHVPFGFSLCDSLELMFREKVGHGDYRDHFNMPFRDLDILPSKRLADYGVYHPHLPHGARVDEWGVAHVPGGAHHFEKMLHPMGSFTSPDQVHGYPYPDVLADYRWEDLAGDARKIQDRGLAAVFFAIQIFEPAWYLRGMENLLMDMVSDEAMAAACLDRMTRVKAEMCARIARAGIDIIVYGDDVGTQKGMMMRPELWRRWLKPTMETAIRAAKDVKPDLIAYYHSDGAIDDIIPDLIEIGVDVLNPVQPECMDPVKVKETYGDRLSFWGTIGTQTTMPFGTPAQVEDTVRRMIETVGRNGGLVIAPTHLLEPEVPWENVLALVDAVKRYGRYG
jgi:uroporphyrinogen decarboxylase